MQYHREYTFGRENPILTKNKTKDKYELKRKQ